jgi:FtsP/CotA-like multicopper oxidase with cupredoxin domain
MSYKSLIRTIAVVGGLVFGSPAFAGTYDLTIGETQVNFSGSEKTAQGINGSVPGPTLRFKEGENITINVKNTLDVDTSIHWHGLILPFQQDGVPGISFDGIKPGTTHTYNFPAQQSGTYWYHSHSGLQEQKGIYGSIIIDSAKREPFKYDREYVVVLSDWHDSGPEKILSNLKKQSDYYNYSQRTLSTFFDDAKKMGVEATINDRKDWGSMRMTPTDIADISGYTFLTNGKNPEQNWTGIFKPGERIRLRFINAAAMSYFDVRIPGLKMLVVQADGNPVQPVSVDEFRIAVAETYDVIVRPTEDKAYTIFSEVMSRTGYARGTLAPRENMSAEVPTLRKRPLLTMADMSMEGMEGMDHGSMSGMDHSSMKGMDHSKMGKKPDPFFSPGSGLAPSAANGGKFLSYKHLKAQRPLYKVRKPTREIELRLTGNMERYFWSINGIKYSDAEPIRLQYGERVRFKFVNETMMTHPMHLHGMWMMLDNGSKKWNPIKHTVSVAPGTTLYTETEVDAPGQWAFHCHLMFHMATGMFRKIIVEGGPKQAALNMTDTVQ